MPLRLTHRDQRAAALLLAALCLVAVYFIGIHWWFTTPLQSIEANMAILRAQHQRYRALEAQRPQLQAQLAEAQNTPAGNDSLLPDTDTGTATAQLMQWVVAKVQALPPDNGGCTMNNRIPIVTADTAPYRQVKVSVSLDCSIAPLVTLLHGLENPAGDAVHRDPRHPQEYAPGERSHPAPDGTAANQRLPEQPAS
ncbi:type II secretion system protein GspM [Pseudomonas asplenii]|uniref:type II secretion system protein GspM n=1 Tax=Pseudomonas asplenii TaxID=53407 RepID=UPI0002E68777|nr:type II secretion system protein GspM [Pseudomonas fuscovaginae]